MSYNTRAKIARSRELLSNIPGATVSLDEFGEPVQPTIYPTRWYRSERSRGPASLNPSLYHRRHQDYNARHDVIEEEGHPFMVDLADGDYWNKQMFLGMTPFRSTQAHLEYVHGGMLPNTVPPEPMEVGVRHNRTAYRRGAVAAADGINKFAVQQAYKAKKRREKAAKVMHSIKGFRALKPDTVNKIYKFL